MTKGTVVSGYYGPLVVYSNVAAQANLFCDKGLDG